MKASEVKQMNKHIKFGAFGGFLYCGASADIDFDAIDRKVMFAKTRTVENYRTRIEQIDRALKSPEKAYSLYALKAHRRAKPYDKWLKSMEREKVAKIERMANELTDMVNYIKMEDREVLEVYPSVTEKADIVIVEGDEIGNAWDTEEFEKQKGVLDEVIECRRN